MSPPTIDRWPPRWRPLDHDPQAVKAARQQINWTQRQLAEHVGISKGYVSEIESGKRNANLALIERLAAALRCPAESLKAPHLQ